MPHGGELRVPKDNINDAGAMDGWVRVDRSCNLFNAAHNDVFLSFTATDSRETSSTLTIETEVLSEGLEEHDIVGVLLEQFQGVAILFEVT